MALIAFLGDIHGNFQVSLRLFERMPESDRPVAAIFLGDLDPQRPLADEFKPYLDLGIEPYFIFGNHEIDTEAQFENMWGSPAFHARCLHGRVVEIAGVRVAGLAGVFRGEIWMPRATSNAPATEIQYRSYAEYKTALAQKHGIKKRLSKLDAVQMQAVPSYTGNMDLLDASKNNRLRKHMSTIFPDDFDRLADMRADVLVSHEAPSCHPNGFAEVDLLAESMGARISLHAHHHDCLDYSCHYDRLGFKAYGVGLRGISAVDTETMAVTKVLAGELDDHRKFRQGRMEP